MKAELQFDFIVNQADSSLTVKREFAAPRALVWDCYSNSELLDQWYAPKPFSTRTKHMDFRPGGYWHFVMLDPNGGEYWNRNDYLSIEPQQGYRALDGFSDAEGNINPEMPRANMELSFSDKGAHTLVKTVVRYESLADLEKVIAMGLQEGLSATLERLDELLQELQ